MCVAVYTDCFCMANPVDAFMMLAVFWPSCGCVLFTGSRGLVVLLPVLQEPSFCMGHQLLAVGLVTAACNFVL